VYFLGSSHASYYPGAAEWSVQALLERGSGRLLGAQLLGMDGVDKRLDVLATAVRHRLCGDDLAELELGYAPPFSSARDPVNVIGMMIQNLLEGRVRQYHWHEVAGLLAEGETLIDVRTPAEYAQGHIEGAVNIPVDALRERLGELNKDKPIYLYCRSGARSYVAARLLMGHGFDAAHLAGGYRLYLPATTGRSLLYL
jgi:rhodanese-related sulfurtransferase